MKKSLLFLVSGFLVCSSLYGEDAYFAHINQVNKKLIEVNQNPQRLDEKDEVLKITAEGISLYSHADRNTHGDVRGANSIRSYTGNDAANALTCSSHSDDETKAKESVLCQSIFVTWSGNAGSTLVNTIYGPLANIALSIRTLGQQTIQGFKYFGAVDYDKIDEFAEENGLKEYQIKLIAKR